MRLIENVISVFAPHICMGCGVEENKLLCPNCVLSLPEVPSRCYKCKAVTEAYAVCKNCAATTPLRQVAVFTHHTGLPKELVHRMKYERAQAGIYEAACLAASCLDHFPADAVLTQIPTATSRVRARGYDHAALLARYLAAERGIAPRRLLARVGQAHQVGRRRAERLRQLEGAFRSVHAPEVRGKHIVLIDDVLTTGATLETAARVLKQAGAARVSAIVFAQA